jgi:cell division protein FtsN
VVQTAKPVPPAPAPAKAAAAPPAKPASAPPVKTVEAKPAPAPVPAKPAPVKAPPAAAPAPPAAAGGAVLQIGAYKSEAEAQAAWKTYQGRHATLLAGYGPDIARADLGDKGVWYRLRIAGFADKDVASALCDRLKADGGACFLGK